ncbi:MAG: polymer-forming cytoskeletal protein [Elusimicrobiales bacterium]|nr:polymer-forming cytoskeletal protein [Elusimicrobiales bacterium]
MFKQSQALFETKNNDTIVGNEAYFQGTLTTKGSVLVDGRIEGSIFEAKTVSVGKNGKITGDINCEACCIGGEVRGNVTALESVELLAGALIQGDIKTKRMIMEEGAVFNGRCEMSSSPQRADNSVQKNDSSEEGK